MSEDRELYWAKPLKARRYHIFEDGQALCGGWMMTKDDDPVDTESDSYREDKDCKECCRKADLEVDE